MNENKNIEEILKKIADAGKLDPPNEAWIHIANNLPEKKKKGGLFFPFLWFFVASSLGFLLYFLFSKEKIKTQNYTENYNSVVEVPSENLYKTSQPNTLVESVILPENSNQNIVNSHDSSNKYNNSVTYTIGHHTGQDKIKNPIYKNDQIESQKVISMNSEIAYSSSFPSNIVENIEGLEKLDPLKLLISYNSNLRLLKLNPKYCVDFKNKNSPLFFFDIYVGLGSPLKNIAVDAQIDNPLLELRKETEKPWYVWTLGGAIGLEFDNNISISSGIQFHQIKEKFNFEQEGVKKIIVTFEPDGTPLDTAYITGKSIENGEIKYNLIDIPITLGYSLNTSDKWSIKIEAGPIFNLSMAASGKIISNESYIRRREDLALFEKSIGIGLYGGLGLERKIGEKSIVYLKPNYRYSLKNWNIDNSPIQIKYNSFVLNLGFKKYF